MKTFIFTLFFIVGLSIATPYFGYSSSEEEFEEYLPLTSSSEESSEEVALAGSDWRMEALNHENEKRDSASLKPYKLDKKLNKEAQQWAEKIAARCSSSHDTMKAGEAESIAEHFNKKGTSAATYVKDGIDRWFAEYEKYDCSPIYQKDVKSKGTPRNKYYVSVGHYMNTMNSAKTKVGYGYAKNDKCKKGFSVARYGGQDEEIMAKAWKKAKYDVNKLNLADFAPCPQ